MPINLRSFFPSKDQTDPDILCPAKLIMFGEDAVDREIALGQNWVRTKWEIQTLRLWIRNKLNEDTLKEFDSIKLQFDFLRATGHEITTTSPVAKRYEELWKKPDFEKACKLSWNKALDNGLLQKTMEFTEHYVAKF